MKQQLEQIRRDSRKHGSMPFWSWNDKLEEEELRRQIRHMHELGMGGFFMHARGGLETEYQSKEWFDCIRACIDEAKKHGMEAWAYDENGWPSGFAGGALLKDPENLIAYLICEQTTEFPAESDDLLGVYLVDENGATRLKTKRDVPPQTRELTVIRRGRSPIYVDTMNPKVAEQFIEQTYEVYLREVGEELGKTMPGFFTDEPQYYLFAPPWSDTFKTTFAERFGYDILDHLPAVFFDYEGAREFRYDYRLHCHESFYEHFMKPLYDWCEAHGVQLTGHGVEEWGLFWQMSCCGGIMPFYRYQHLPGIDFLRRPIRDISGARQLGSVCEQLGKKRALSEMFASCGWDVSPRELKRIADLQFAGGVNLICEHLYPYSERGQRKRDYPCHYAEHNPWQKEFHRFEQHYRNLGAALTQGAEIADTLVIHPIRSAYFDYRFDRKDSIAELDGKFTELIRRLSLDHIPYHFGDEGMLRDLGAVEGNRLRLGNCTYGRVLIPYCYTLDASTVTLLRDYLANGGRLCLWEGCPDRIDGRKADLSFLRANMTYDELKRTCGLSVTRGGENILLHSQLRRTDKGRLLYLTNPTAQMYDNTEITLSDCRGLCRIDIDTLETHSVRGQRNPDGSVTVLYDFDDSGSLLLAECEEEMLPFVKSEAKAPLSPDFAFTLTELPENMYLLDEAILTLEGQSTEEVRPIVRIRDELLSMRYEGEVTLTYTFVAEARPRQLLLVGEPMRYRRVMVNGREISLTGEHWRFDRRFVGAEIADATVLGKNTVSVTFAYYQRPYVYEILYKDGGNDTLRKCLAFDTEVEPMYLYGDFCVKASGFSPYDKETNTYRASGPYALTERGREIDLHDIVRSGYPFFMGEMTAEATFTHRSGDPTYLTLGGRFSYCRVVINGKDLGVQLFGDTAELAPYLREGENTLCLTLCFSARNLMGPHNRTNPEPFEVMPRYLSYEKQWLNGHCDDYVPEKAFVRFGIGF